MAGELEARDAARRNRYFETIDRETRRLERIVTDLLDLARYEGGGVISRLPIASVVTPRTTWVLRISCSDASVFQEAGDTGRSLR